MVKQSPSVEFLTFAEYVKKLRGDKSNLSILDLRIECRRQRLEEYADWPLVALDIVEHEAASYGDASALVEVAAGTVQSVPATCGQWLHSPSPFAWT